MISTGAHFAALQDDGCWGCLDCDWTGKNIDDYWAAHETRRTMTKEGHAMDDLKELIEDGAVVVSGGKLFIQWEGEK